MKTIYKLVLLNLFILIFGVSKIKAQSELPLTYYNFSWQISDAISGGMKDWIDETSYNGICFEGAGFLTENFALGGEISHNYSYQRFDKKTFVFSNTTFEGAITGVQFRSSRIVPLLLKGYYHFDVSENVKPYAAVSAGTAYMENDLATGIYYIDDYNWGFAAGAEAGIRVLFGPLSNIGIFTSIKYSYANIKLAGIESNNLNRLNYNLGMSFLVY